MGNKLWLMQHDELKKGGIISMFIHLFKEMCGFVSMCVCVCVFVQHISQSTLLLLPLLLICWMSPLLQCVCVCVFV